VLDRRKFFFSIFYPITDERSQNGNGSDSIEDSTDSSTSYSGKNLCITRDSETIESKTIDMYICYLHPSIFYFLAEIGKDKYNQNSSTTNIQIEDFDHLICKGKQLCSPYL
jgi:hypothetical protein